MGIEAISITLLSPSPSSSYYIRIVCTLHFHQPTHSLARLRFLALGGIYLRYLQKFNFLPLSPPCHCHIHQYPGLLFVAPLSANIIYKRMLPFVVLQCSGLHFKASDPKIRFPVSALHQCTLHTHGPDPLNER